MNLISILFDTLFDIWIWNITWGWYQIIFGIISMWLLIICSFKIKNIPALLLTFGSYMFAFILLSFITITIISLELPAIEYIFQETSSSLFFISFQLSSIYILLQILFFYLIQKWHKLKLLPIIKIIIMNQTISAIFATLIIKYSIIQP